MNYYYLFYYNSNKSFFIFILALKLFDSKKNFQLQSPIFAPLQSFPILSVNTKLSKEVDIGKKVSLKEMFILLEMSQGFASFD